MTEEEARLTEEEEGRSTPVFGTPEHDASKSQAAEPKSRTPISQAAEPKTPTPKEPSSPALEVKSPQTTRRGSGAPFDTPTRKTGLSVPSERPPRGPFPWKKLCIYAGAVTALGLISTLLGGYFVVQHFSKDLPDVRTLEHGYEPPQVTRVLARDGTLLDNIFSERRTVVPVSRMPDHVKSAFLAAEDAGFFEHEGLDFLGLMRAMAANLRAGRVKQGGSTITQQVVKNVLLDHERSYRRKIRETILAYRLEKTLTKEQILGLYLNQIYLGHGRYGVEEAGRHLFGKHVEELDVAEAALLAGIVAAPERYSPYKSEEKALLRRKYVLSQMLHKGFMTEGAYKESIEAPLRLAPQSETESDIAPEVVSRALRALRESAGDASSRGGFTITTTIDPELQVMARTALRQGLDDYLKRQKLAPPYTLDSRRLWGKTFLGHPRRHKIYVGLVKARDDKRNVIQVQVGDVVGEVDLAAELRFNPTHLPPSEFVAEGAALRVRVVDSPDDATQGEPVRLKLELGPQAALVALSPDKREILALVGSYEALSGDLDRTSQTKRQPGSTFKPVVYSYALNTHQITAATQFTFPLEAKPNQAPPAEDGTVAVEPTTETLSLREGIAQSDNRVAQRVFREVGAPQAVQWARALGITSHLGADESLMLGSYEVSVEEMASVYSVFASGGTALAPTMISGILRSSSQTGDETRAVELGARAVERRVMEPAVAYLTTNLLESVVKTGTGKRASSLGRPLAGKTGTTNQAKDAWFVGYSPDLVVAVWVGYDDALPLGWGEAGASAALPIWMQFMKDAHRGKPLAEFPRPAGIQEVEIDPRTGLLSRFGQEGGVREIFLEGTAPKEESPEEIPTPSEDAALDANTDEVVDPGPDAPGPRPEPDSTPPPPPPPPGPELEEPPPF